MTSNKKSYKIKKENIRSAANIRTALHSNTVQVSHFYCLGCGISYEADYDVKYTIKWYQGKCGTGQ
jgi:hypothetical protein